MWCVLHCIDAEANKDRGPGTLTPENRSPQVFQICTHHLALGMWLAHRSAGEQAGCVRVLRAWAYHRLLCLAPVQHTAFRQCLLSKCMGEYIMNRDSAPPFPLFIWLRCPSALMRVSPTYKYHISPFLPLARCWKSPLQYPENMYMQYVLIKKSPQLPASSFIAVY